MVPCLTAARRPRTSPADGTKSGRRRRVRRQLVSGLTQPYCCGGSGLKPRLFEIARFWKRLDHLDAAAVADVCKSPPQRGGGHEGLYLADMSDAHRRAAS